MEIKFETPTNDPVKLDNIVDSLPFGFEENPGDDIYMCVDVSAVDLELLPGVVVVVSLQDGKITLQDNDIEVFPVRGHFQIVD